MTKVFVGNFSFAIDDEKLKEHFATVGNVVSAKVMTEGHGGRSRGFGFVEMASPDDAKKAIEELDGKSWDGRVIKVSEDRSNKGPGGAGGSGGHDRERRSSYGDGGSDRRDSSGPMGYFRAQPLDLGIRKKKKTDPFDQREPKVFIDYKDPKLLARFMSERGRVLPRRMTGLTSHNQRMVTKAIRRAQHLALLPYLKD